MECGVSLVPEGDGDRYQLTPFPCARRVVDLTDNHVNTLPTGLMNGYNGTWLLVSRSSSCDPTHPHVV